jgi:ATP-dependent exoDNAse (exonuclease V) beta subunit
MLYYRRLTQNPSFDGELDGLFENVNSIVRGTMPIEAALGLDETDSLSSALSKSTCLYDLCTSLLRIYHLDTIRDAFLNYFLEEVFKFQSGTKEGIQEFLALWEKKQGELSVKSASGNALNITTIHKSKGLEFNVVIYPDAITDLDEKLKTTPAEEWISPENLDFESIPNLEKVLFKLDKTAEMMGERASQAFENEKENNRLDNLNLLYVAFTRAKQRLYVMAKQGKAGKEHVLQAFVEDETIDINKVSIKTEGEGVVSYLYGEAEFSNPIVTQSDENQPVEMLDSPSADWFKKIQVDSLPSMFWISPEDPMQPREWGELVHQILSEIRSVDDIDTVLQSYLLEGTLNRESANQLKDRFLQMAHHPLIAAAFGKEAKVKNECEILCDHEILRPDRYAELPDAIYLIDYKTGKKDEAHHVQLKNYIFALQGMVTKEIRAFLVYLSDSIEVEAVTMDTLF